MLYNALSVGKKTPKIVPYPWDFVTPPEEDRATVIGNMHKKFGKDRECGSGDMLADRQTDRQTCSLQYFATAPADEVTRQNKTDKRNVLFNVDKRFCHVLTFFF